jgi:hypothetical protein
VVRVRVRVRVRNRFKGSGIYSRKSREAAWSSYARWCGLALHLGAVVLTGAKKRVQAVKWKGEERQSEVVQLCCHFGAGGRFVGKHNSLGRSNRHNGGSWA